jgi:hypothetical protein
MAHQGDDVGDADMVERFDGAIVESARHPARVGEHDCHFIDDLLALVGEGRWQAGDDGLDLVGWHPDFLATPLMRGSRVNRMKPADNDADGNLALRSVREFDRHGSGRQRGPRLSVPPVQAALPHRR